VFTVRYGLSPYIQQTRLVIKGLKANLIQKIPIKRANISHVLWETKRVIFFCFVSLKDQQN
jgi:hypothetical protein